MCSPEIIPFFLFKFMNKLLSHVIPLYFAFSCLNKLSEKLAVKNEIRKFHFLLLLLFIDPPELSLLIKILREKAKKSFSLAKDISLPAAKTKWCKEERLGTYIRGFDPTHMVQRK